MKIVLCCASGMSTSLLVEKMKEAAREKGIEAKIIAVASKDIKANSTDAAVILLGPQVLYMKDKIVTEVGSDIPVAMVSMEDYGMMNGEAVLEQALDILGK